tara:strand:+ start:33 stop:380 length:348 start_codon:yes stop_codon:yes gene_type:complete
MSDAPHFKSLAEFYPYYLSEHSLKSTRTAHFIGTTLFFVILILAIKNGQYSLLWFLPIAGYGFAWFGHFFLEKNKPATFKYPLFSLISDFIMFWHMLTFQIKGKMEEAMQKYPKA